MGLSAVSADPASDPLSLSLKNKHLKKRKRSGSMYIFKLYGEGCIKSLSKIETTQFSLAL